MSLSKVEETSKRQVVWRSEQEGKTQRPPPQAELHFSAWIPTIATKYTVPLSRVLGYSGALGGRGKDRVY